MPLRDLDEAASGSRDASPFVDVSADGVPMSWSADGRVNRDTSPGNSTEDVIGIAQEVSTDRAAGQGDERDSVAEAATVVIRGEGGVEATVADVGTEVGSLTVPELPNDLPNAPVTGTITHDVASWEVDGGMQPTFEIRTPTASYTVLQGTGGIISILDVGADQRQWVDYSSGFRPLRGVPGLGALPLMTTTLDDASQTLTHVRLICQSQTAAWSWVWDFYVTHVTITVIHTPGAYGFGYRGVPGGLLDASDQLVLPSGAAQSAESSFDGDLPGPTEWTYLVDTTLGRSLFLIQHGDDALPDHYQVKDSDSANFVFGDGMITQTPLRFSLGLVNSGAFDTVKERVAFVIAAIH